MSIASISGHFGFFSQQLHDNQQGGGTLELYDQAAGDIVKVNWMGPSIGGYPGIVKNGAIARPKDYETFVCLGRIGRGRLVPKPTFLNVQRPQQS
jgi:hypothetical protein